MTVSIVSIPHTGTKFTEKVLHQMGCTTRHAHFHSEHPAQNGRVWLHDAPKVVVPWRDPAKSQESARKRGEEPRGDAEYTELLEWANTRPNVHLFNIEPVDRLAELASLAEFVGADVPPDVDWTPVNSFQGTA